MTMCFTMEKKLLEKKNYHEQFSLQTLVLDAARLMSASCADMLPAKLTVRNSEINTPYNLYHSNHNRRIDSIYMVGNRTRFILESRLKVCLSTRLYNISLDSIPYLLKCDNKISLRYGQWAWCNIYRICLYMSNYAENSQYGCNYIINRNPLKRRVLGWRHTFANVSWWWCNGKRRNVLSLQGRVSISNFYSLSNACCSIARRLINCVSRSG